MLRVQAELALGRETLYLAVFLLDKYCSCQPIQASQYQLLGLTALFVAAKYEEIKTPRLKHYGSIVKGTYEPQQILEMESLILTTLSFQIRVMTSLDFLGECLSCTHSHEQLGTMAHYLLELSLVEYGFCLLRPSLLSWAVLQVASHKVGSHLPPTQPLSDITGQELKETSRLVEGLFSRRYSAQFREVNRKYSCELP
jgi:hypothetical protein